MLYLNNTSQNYVNTFKHVFVILMQNDIHVHVGDCYENFRFYSKHVSSQLYAELYKSRQAQ